MGPDLAGLACVFVEKIIRHAANQSIPDERRCDRLRPRADPTSPPPDRICRSGREISSIQTVTLADACHEKSSCSTWERSGRIRSGFFKAEAGNSGSAGPPCWAANCSGMVGGRMPPAQAGQR